MTHPKSTWKNHLGAAMTVGGIMAMITVVRMGFVGDSFGDAIWFAVNFVGAILLIVVFFLVSISLMLSK